MLPTLISKSLLRSVTGSQSIVKQLCQSSIVNVRKGNQDSKISASVQEVQVDTTPEDIAKTKEIWSKVNEQIKDKSYGRLFAVIAIDQHQHKLTDGDLLMVLSDIGASLGQRIRLDKVLMIGSKDFSLIGRPILPRDLATVEATVVEKSLSHKKIVHRNSKTKVRHNKFVREDTTTIRINKIELLKPVDETQDRLGYEKPNDKYN